ncbi:MAG: lamin tail domain-containing protein [Bacteroidales bacterium]|nr:lamin tail domain-containing protein [Bacteroidales bacterium]
MIRHIILSLLVLLLSAACAVAQDVRNYFIDGFNDVANWRQDAPNFINQDGWFLDTSNVYDTDVISKQIDNYIPENGDTYWRISLMCGYENSSVNNFQFYLIANGDNPDAEGFHGVAVGTGFKPDYKALSLIYRHDGISEVIGTTTITFKKNQVTIIDIVRSAAGAWSIGDDEIYAPETPSAMLANHIVAAFSFNKTGAGQFAFKFDKFSQSDNSINIASSINNAIIVSPTAIKIDVSGRLEAESATDVKNYSVGGVTPTKVDYNFYDIILHYPDTIPNKGEILMVVDGLRDSNDDKVVKFQHTFHQALADEIIINEIMVDINPVPYSLPVKKYVELYNTSAGDFDLDGYVFRVGDVDYNLPKITIKADGYLILASDETNFERYGQCVAAFQESKLTVAGKHIALINKLGAVVDSLTYSTDYYNDKDRSEGGFSMERLDPYNNCTGSLNWHSSNDLSGGTPGRRNSVYKIYVDETIPAIDGCQLLTNSTLQIDFTENIKTTDFTIGGQKPSSQQIDGQSVTFIMSEPFKSGITKIKGRAVDVCDTESDALTAEVNYTPLKVESVYAVSSYQVLVNFTTAVSVYENENFILENGAMPSLSEPINDGSNSLLLTFADDFTQDSKMRLTIDGVENNIHDRIENQNVTFHYHRVGEGDLIINEVLYYPSVGMKRYVEIVNNSGSDIFLFGLVLSGYTASGDLLRSCIVDGYAMLADGEFAVITADTASVALNYNAKGLLLEASRFPSLNTARGYVSLRSADGVVLDSMYYDNDMHNELLAVKRGVALERVSIGKPSMDKENWTSASEQFGFATPGFVNSCSSDAEPDDGGDNPDLPNQAVTIENQLMRPGDSDKEFTMTFNFNRPTDPMISVTVYDDHGRRMRCIADEVMAYPGFSVAWDGRDNHGSYCKSGIYVVVIKAVDDTGWSFEKKEACVIGRFR